MRYSIPRRVTPPPLSSDRGGGNSFFSGFSKDNVEVEKIMYFTVFIFDLVRQGS